MQNLTNQQLQNIIQSAQNLVNTCKELNIEPHPSVQQNLQDAKQELATRK